MLLAVLFLLGPEMHTNCPPTSLSPSPPRARRGIGASGYATGPVTKAPDWHGLVAWDLLLNNLTTGLFLAAAIGELADAGGLHARGEGGLSDRPRPLAR